MAHPSFQKIGDYLKGFFAVAGRAVAAGAGDNAETNGSGIDRQVAGGGGLYQSAVFCLGARAVLSANKKLTVKATFQDSADDSTYADIAAALQPEGAADSVVLTLTDSGAGSTLTGSYFKDLELASLRRYIRAQVHIDLDAGATDTCEYAATWQLGGLKTLPLA